MRRLHLGKTEGVDRIPIRKEPEVRKEEVEIEAEITDEEYERQRREQDYNFDVILVKSDGYEADYVYDAIVETGSVEAFRDYDCLLDDEGISIEYITFRDTNNQGNFQEIGTYVQISQGRAYDINNFDFHGYSVILLREGLVDDQVRIVMGAKNLKRISRSTSVNPNGDGGPLDAYTLSQSSCMYIADSYTNWKHIDPREIHREIMEDQNEDSTE